MLRKKKALVTGVTGQDGSYMVDYLLNNTDVEIYGGVRRLSVPNHQNIEHNLDNPRFNLINLDITDAHNISGAIQDIKPDYFINFAAQSFVGCSWEMPMATWKTNADSVLHILEAIRKHNPRTRLYQAGCYDSKTKIVTNSGLKTIDEVKEGDFVLSLNPKTRNTEYKKITKRIKYRHKGKMIKIKGVGKNLLVTPNHNMYYQSHATGELLKCRADEFIKKSRAQFPRSTGHSGKTLPEETDLTPFIPEKSFDKKIEIKTINTLDLLYLMGLFIGDRSSMVMEKQGFACDHNERKRNSDGHFLPVDESQKRDIVYSCAQSVIDIPKTDPAFQKLTSVLDKNGISWNIHGQCDVTFRSWGLHHFFKQCGTQAKNKKIPEWIFSLDKKYQVKLYEGIMDSDGCLSKNTVEQTSQILSEQLFVLAANIGLNSVRSSRAPRISQLKDGRLIEGKSTTYCNSFSSRNRFFRNKINTEWYKNHKTYEVIDYNDDVWCLEVEDNHNFLVCREGVSMFCGNSSEEFGDVLYYPQDENHPLRPRSPYGASKAANRHLIKVYRESYGLYAIQGWLFNHESRRRPKQFVTQKIVEGVARIRQAMYDNTTFEPIKLGNMGAKRDWSHSLDFVRAVWLMLNQEDHDPKIKSALEKNPVNSQAILTKEIKDYVCASGETHSVAEFVERAFEQAGIDAVLQKEGDWDTAKFVLRLNPQVVLVEVDPQFFRPAEVELLLGDPNRIKNRLGWYPEYSFEDLIKDMVEAKI